MDGWLGFNGILSTQVNSQQTGAIDSRAINELLKTD